MANGLLYGLIVQAHNRWLSEFPRESRDEKLVLIVLRQPPRTPEIVEEFIRYEGQNSSYSHARCASSVGDMSSGEEHVENVFSTDFSELG